MADVDVALTLLGYQGDAPPEFVDWRTRAVHGAHHGYEVRRGIVDALPLDVLRLRPDKLAGELAACRDELRKAVAAA
jgi:hypothetical protein